MKLIDRAKNNELNCQAGAGQILYSLAIHGLLNEPYRSWATGLAPTEGKDLEMYNKALLDVSESIVMFNDEIKEGGKIQ